MFFFGIFKLCKEIKHSKSIIDPSKNEKHLFIDLVKIQIFPDLTNNNTRFF